MGYSKKQYLKKDYYIIPHDYNGSINFLVQFYNEKISVVCDDRIFGSHAIRNYGIGYNNSFGNRLKQVYREVMGRDFAVTEKVKTGGVAGGFEERNFERTDSSIGIELFAHVYYLIITRLIQRGERAIEGMLTEADKMVLAKGTASIERSSIFADLDIWGGNSGKIISAYRMGEVERKTIKKDIFKYLRLKTDTLVYLSK